MAQRSLKRAGGVLGLSLLVMAGLAFVFAGAPAQENVPLPPTPPSGPPALPDAPPVAKPSAPPALPDTPPLPKTPALPIPTPEPDKALAKELGVPPPSADSPTPVLPNPAAPPVAVPSAPAVEKTKTPEIPVGDQPPPFQPLGGSPSPANGLNAPAPDPVAATKTAASMAPMVSVDKTGPTMARVGETVQFEIVVRNEGTVPATNVVILDAIPSQTDVVDTTPQAQIQHQRMMWKVETLAVGSEKRFVVRLRPQNAGDLECNTAVAVEVAERRLSTRVTENPLRVEVTAPGQVGLSQKIPLKITINNVSAAAQGGLLLTLSLPDGISHRPKSAKGEPLPPVTGMIETDVDSIAPGAKKVIDVPLDGMRGGKFDVGVTVTDAAKNTTKQNVTIVIVDQPMAQLKFTKSGTPTPKRGELTTYQINVTNPGNADAQNVVVTEQLPDGLEFREASDKGVYSAKDRTVQWILGTLKAGQTRAVGMRVIGQKAGEMSNQVTAQAAGGLHAETLIKLQVQP